MPLEEVERLDMMRKVVFEDRLSQGCSASLCLCSKSNLDQFASVFVVIVAVFFSHCLVKAHRNDCSSIVGTTLLIQAC